MWQKKKDELQHKHSLIFPSGAKTGQREKTTPCLSVKRKHLDQTEVLVCRINWCWLSNPHSVSLSLTIWYGNSTCNISSPHQTQCSVWDPKSCWTWPDKVVDRLLQSQDLNPHLQWQTVNTEPRLPKYIISPWILLLSLSSFNTFCFLHFSWAMHIQKLLTQVQKMFM